MPTGLDVKEIWCRDGRGESEVARAAADWRDEYAGLRGSGSEMVRGRSDARPRSCGLIP